MGRRKSTPVVTVDILWNALTAAYGVAGSYGEAVENILAALIALFTDYEYETDLAAAANYVPPAQTIFSYGAEAMGDTDIEIQWYDSVNTAWLKWSVTAEPGTYIQSASQRYRFLNDGAGDLAIGVHGITWG